MKLNCCNNTDSCTPAYARRQAGFSPVFAGLTPFFDLIKTLPPEQPRLAVHVREDDAGYTARFEVPGVKKEGVQIDILERQLTVKVTRPDLSGAADATWTATRTLTLPDTVKMADISASLEDGVLTLTLPKADPVKPRTITVN
jgi:HSP20 family protein